MEINTDECKEEIFSSLVRVFQPDRAGGITTNILFDLTGEGGFQFYGLIANGSLTFSEEPQSAKVRMRMPIRDFIGLLRGTISANEAFLLGKLKVGGNLFHAMRLAPVFRFGQSAEK